MRDYDWFAAGGGFDASDDQGLCDAFMRNLTAASRLLDGSVDAAAWRRTTGIDALYLVAEHDERQQQPDISKPVMSDGVWTFGVTYNWLAEEFTDRKRGAWQTLGLLTLVLATISRETDTPLPQLPSGWPT